MDVIATRYSGLVEGQFHHRTGWDQDLREGELATAVARAKAGDPEAVRYLYCRFSANVYGYARSLVRDEHEAEDITQLVFARLLTSIARYEDRGLPFAAWLLRITRNLAIDHMRRTRATVPTDAEPVEGGDERRGEELGRSLRDALAELPEHQREVLVLRHVTGWTPREIASHTGRTEKAVHSLHHRGRRELRRRLVEREATPLVEAA